jgi:hypothetical protein
VTKAKVIAGTAFLMLLVSTGWRSAACELAHYGLQDELTDVASLNRKARINFPGCTFATHIHRTSRN